MKKIILIFCLLFAFTSSCLAASVTTAVKGVVGAGASAAASCEGSPTGPSQATQNSGTAIGTQNAQKLKITSTITVCKVDWFFGTGETGTCKVQFWTDVIRAGTQIGGDSDTVTCAGWPVAFTWSANRPELTTDAYMHIVPVAGTQNAIGTNTSADSYEDTNYDLWVESGGDYNQDGVFRVYKYY